MTRRLPLLVAALVCATGCAAPDRRVELGFKEVPSDVVLGAQTSPSPTPISAVPGPPTVSLPPPPSVVTLPPPTFEVPVVGPRPEPPPPLPPAQECPEADPLAAPKVEAPPSVAKPPVQTAYLFDNVGTFSVSGADARKGTFPARTLRLVTNVMRFSEGFSYDVIERIGDTTTTTTYTVITGATLPGQENGLFLAAMTYVRADGTTANFRPTPALKLAGLPLIRGTTTDQSGVDPETQTAMSFTSTVTGKERVFACGEPLDTWTVELTAGRLISPTQDLDFTATYQLATQYGGIFVRDSVAFAGTDGDAGLQRSNRATIASVPKTP